MLPDDLGDAFSVRAALAAGVTPSRLRGADLARPFHASRAMRPARGASAELFNPAEQQRLQAQERAMDYSVLMSPHQFFSHETAAIMWGIPLPWLRDTDPHLSVFQPARLPRTRGIHGHETKESLCEVVLHPTLGVMLTSPATTWAMLGAVLRDEYDLVAAGDAVIRIPRMPGGFDKDLGPALAPLASLRTAVESGRRVGRPALRLALDRLRTGSSSRPESWCRLLIVDAGLPEPELDFDVYDDRNGVFIGCVDLAYPELRIAIEYEGDQHRTNPAQWQRDIDKHDQLAAAGWRVIRVSRDHVFGSRRDLVARVARALRERSA